MEMVENPPRRSERLGAPLDGSLWQTAQLLAGDFRPRQLLIGERLPHIRGMVPHRLGEEDRVAERLPLDHRLGVFALRSVDAVALRAVLGREQALAPGGVAWLFKKTDGVE